MVTNVFLLLNVLKLILLEDVLKVLKANVLWHKMIKMLKFVQILVNVLMPNSKLMQIAIQLIMVVQLMEPNVLNYLFVKITQYKNNVR